MTPTIGHAAIVVGLALTAYAVVAFILAARRGDAGLEATGRRAVTASFAAAGVACLAMVASLLAHDFSVLYVAENNATTTPPFIGAISLWAALEGSILFWALLATGWAALVLHRQRGRHRQLMPWVGATLASVNLFFFAVLVWPGNPFVRVTPAGTEGTGPNALLQNHPFMALHPPLLYLGYTGLAVPFAFGVAALITRRLDVEWLRVVRRWTLVPWTFLTLGIVAGAWWSYEVLGWGGYWAWDPVENAALLPWLTATAFVHSAIVAERRGGLRIWTSLLVLTTFVLTLLGTFLTRSGVVLSVHSFTLSSIGQWFFAAIIVAATVGLTLLVWRLPDLGGGGRPSSLLSRESAFLFNNVLFVAITIAVLFGTLLPWGWSIATGETISIGAPWYNRVTVPMLVALLFLMGIGPALPWGAASFRTLRERFTLPAIVATAVVAVVALLGMREPGTLGIVGLAVLVGTVMLEEVVRGARARVRGRDEDPATATWRLATRNRRRYGGYVVHLGVLVMAVGIAVSSALVTDRTVTLAPGESATIGAYTLTHDELVVERLPDDPRVIETRAEVTYAGPQSGQLGTALRDYPNSAAAVATPAVRTSLGEDLYVTLHASDPETGAVTLHVLVRPLVAWIWIGGAIVGIGSAFAIWPERRRGEVAVTEAARAPSPAPAPTPPLEGA
ncbi:MAG TPA: heme lyase CcmF/NrfE family subunit [Candidatus Limnocylindria bacterium]|nr:heme lyase CcmF/NrfE family subunit [Candidatus Limnocylindria bacterium]